MGQKFKILGSLVAFLILAGISCWATEKSLHLLLPAGWPEVLVWGITIAFFVMASYGSKLIVDTLSSPDFIDNRNLKLFGGVLLLFFFWFIMSMPTNTHTFFYNDKIGSVSLETVIAIVVGIVVCLGYNVFYFEMPLPNGTNAQILDIT